MTTFELVAVAVLFVAIDPAPARGQTAGAQAETMFERGKELMKQDRVAEACLAFDASQRLEATVSTLLNRAACRERNGQLATALGLFLEAERQTRTGTDRESQRLHQVASDRAARLRPRISTLTLRVPRDGAVESLEILRDGEPVAASVSDQPLPIDGGTHAITVRAKGRDDWTSSVTVGLERDVQVVEIQLGPAAPLPTVAAIPAPPLEVARAETDPAASAPFARGRVVLEVAPLLAFPSGDYDGAFVGASAGVRVGAGVAVLDWLEGRLDARYIAESGSEGYSAHHWDLALGVRLLLTPARSPRLTFRVDGAVLLASESIQSSALGIDDTAFGPGFVLRVGTSFAVTRTVSVGAGLSASRASVSGTAISSGTVASWLAIEAIVGLAL